MGGQRSDFYYGGHNDEKGLYDGWKMVENLTNLVFLEFADCLHECIRDELLLLFSLSLLWGGGHSKGSRVWVHVSQ